MSPFTSCQLLLLLLLMSSCDQVFGADGYPTPDVPDHNESSKDQPTSLALTTSSEQGDGYVSGNVDNTNPAISSGQSRKCAQYDDHPSIATRTIELAKRYFKNDGTKAGNGDGFDPNNGSVQCDSYCFTLWVANPGNNSKATVSKQGCWLNSEGKECQTEYCISNLPPRQNNTHFCCCTGNMCNSQFHDVYNPAEHTTTTTPAAPVAVGPLHDHSYKTKTIIIALVSVVSVSLVIVFLFLAYRLCLTPKPVSPQSSSETRVETPEPQLPEFDIHDLKIEDVIVRGRYSEIRRGWLADQEVAVKIYQPHHRQYYYNERNAFTQPFMDHENLVKFYGAKEQEDPESSLLQYVIVTKYFPLGSLTSYLKHNTVDWYTLCHMSQGVSRGLAHLHTDIHKGDLFKPAIAHRDLNTRNILVNADLTCMLIDLGFSVGMIGSKIIKNGVAENAEQATLADVGTLRYMAPEVFDGAVNLRDCEASLKQIDVYALGLVIWEIASQCIDLYQGAPVPEYQLPFQAEAGTHPTFEEMQVLVVKYKTRPRFPEVWKDANPAVRSLKETIEDCWDTDAEARLTALCVQERIVDMAALWAHGNKHRGVTPTLNATMNLPESSQNGGIHSGSAVVSNGVTYLPTYVDMENETNEAGDFRQREEGNSPVIPTSLRYREDIKTAHYNDEVGVTAPLISNVGHLANSNSFDVEEGRVRSWLQDQSMSGSTMDTLLPPTPSLEDGGTALHAPSPATQPVEHLPPIKASNVMIAINKAVILHPNQGRNPTVERNTHKRSDEELTISGNVLVGPGSQATNNEADRSNRRGSLGTRSAPPNRTGEGGSFDVTDAIESSSLVQNDSLDQYHVRPRNAPIPYFQNHVHGENGGVIVPSYLTRPKLANVSGNRNSYLRLQGEETSLQTHSVSIHAPEKVEAKSLKFKLSKLIRPKDIKIKFSQMVFGGKHKKGLNSHTSNLDVESLAGRNEDSNMISGQYINSGLDASPVNRSISNISTTTPGAVAMEVQIVNGSPVTRAYNETNTNNNLSHQNGSIITGTQGRLSATNVMRLGVFVNSSHEELPSPSLFPKCGSDSVGNDSSCQSGIEQGLGVPLHIVATRLGTDYGSMHPIIVNPAYGLDSDVEKLATDLKVPGLSLATAVDSIQDITITPDYHMAGCLSFDLYPAALNVSYNYPGNSTVGQASEVSESGENFILSSTSSFAPPTDPAHVPASDPSISNTVIQSPQNKTISPLNKPQHMSSFAGYNTNAIVTKYPHDISQGVYSSHNSTTSIGLQNHHTDTKGGNSIMHCIHIEANVGQPKDSSRHFGWSAKRSAQLEVTASPQIIATATTRHSQTKGEDIPDGNTAFSNNILRKSSQELSHSQSVADLNGHENPLVGIEDTDSARTNKRHPNWQDIDLSKSCTFSERIRPKSLSLKGHNYNHHSKGRSASSSSLSSATSLHQTTFSQRNTGPNTNDDSGSISIAVPNVTLVNIGRKPAMIPTTTVAVAVTTNVAASSMRSSGSSDDASHMINNSIANNSRIVGDISMSQTVGSGGSPVTSISANCPCNITTDGTIKTNDNIGAKACSILKDRSDSSEKIRKRIKTPVSFKKGRLSLYDDRLMTQSLGFVSLTDVDGTVGGCENKNGNSSIADFCSLSGVHDNGSGRRRQNGTAGGASQISRTDYHKMIKSESDLVV